MPSTVHTAINIVRSVGLLACLAACVEGFQAHSNGLGKYHQRYYSPNAPEILEHPTNVTIPNGSPAVLFCRVTGNPQPAISWWRMTSPKSNVNDDGDPLGDDDNNSIFSANDIASATFKEVRGRHFNVVFDASKTRSALRIDQVRRRHAGVYRCQATIDSMSNDGQASRPVTSSPAFINVLDESQTSSMRGFPRAFIGDGPTKSVELNSRQTDVILPCDVDGEQPLTVKWLKDSIPLEINNDNMRRSLVGSGSLKIHNVEREDGGHYECLAINAKGTAFSNRIRLDVVLRRVFPYFVNEPPRQLTARAGENVNISCTANGSPFPYVAWYRQQSDSTPTQLPVDPANLFESHLIIHNIHQSANFTCRAQSELGVISASTVVSVVVGEEAASKSSSPTPYKPSSSVTTVSNIGSMNVRRSFNANGSNNPSSLNTAPFTSHPTVSNKIGPRGDGPPPPAAPTANIVKPPRKLRVVSIGERNAVLIWDGRTYEQVVDYFTIYYHPSESTSSTGTADTAASSYTVPLQYVAHITAQRHELTSLEPGTAYEAYVVAEHLGHVSEPSERVTFETMKDGAPRDVRAHAVSSTAVRVNWLPSLVQGKSLRGYDVYYTPTFELQQLPKNSESTGAATTAADEDEKRWRKQSVSVRDTATLLTDLLPRTLYKVKVRPIFWPEIHGPFSAAVVVETQQGVPGQPRDVSIQAIPASDKKATTVDVELFWKPPNSDTSILRYDVHVRSLNTDRTSGKAETASSLLVKPVSAYSTSTLLNGLQVDEQYEVRVMAIGRDGAGPPSEPITIDFGKNNSSGDGQLQDTATTASIDWAADADGAASMPPFAPVIIRVQPISSTSLNVSWQAPAAGHNSARSFRIYVQQQRNTVAASVEAELLEPVKMFSMTLDDVPDGTSGYIVTDNEDTRTVHCWKVVENLQEWSLHKIWLTAVNPSGQESEQSKSLTSRTMESVPGPPQNLHFAVLNASTIRVFWEPPEEPQRANIRYYMVYYSFDDEIRHKNNVPVSHEVGPIWVPGDRAATVTGLTPGRRYQLQVVAFGTKGDGERSQTMLATMPKARPAAPELALTFESAQLQAHLKWRRRTLEDDVTAYAMVYGPTSAFENFTTVRNVTISSAVLSKNAAFENSTELRRKHLQAQDSEMIVAGLERGQQYTFQLYALGESDNDVESISDPAIQSLSIPEGVPDGPPTNIRYQFDQQSVLTFYWDPPRRGKRHGLIRFYEIEVLEQDRAGNIEVILKRTTEDTHLPHAKLKKHYRYLFKVAAATRLGTGPFSQMIHVDVPLEVPKPPTNIQSTAVNWTSIEVWWTPVELATTTYSSQQQQSPLTITGYKVYHSLVATQGESMDSGRQGLSSSAVLRDSLFTDNHHHDEQLALDSLATNGSNIDDWHATSVAGRTAWRARIGGLLPNATYSVVIAAQTDTVTGYLSQPIHVVTQPTIVPRDFRSTMVGSNFVRLEWQPPPRPQTSDADGIGISYYRITCDGTRSFYDENGVQQSPKVPPCVEVNISNATNVMMSHLVPFTDYKFSIAAVPVRQPSYVPPVVHYTKTLPEVPDVVNAPEAVQRVAYDMYSVRTKRSSNKRGPLAYYWLVVVPQSVMGGHDKNAYMSQPESFSNEELLQNSNDSARHLVKPYITAKFLGEEPPITSAASSTFVLGDSNYYGGYYNRALTTSLSYRVFIRVFVRQVTRQPTSDNDEEFVSLISKNSAFSVPFSTGEYDPNAENRVVSPTSSAADAATSSNKASDEVRTSLSNYFFSNDNVSTLVFAACAIAAAIICLTMAMIILRKCCWHRSEPKALNSSDQNKLIDGSAAKSSSGATAIIVTPNGNSSSFRSNAAGVNGLSLYHNPVANGFKPSFPNGINGVHHALPAFVNSSHDTLLLTAQQQQPSTTPSASSTVEAVNVHADNNPYVTSPRDNLYAANQHIPLIEGGAAGSYSGSGSTQSTNIVGSGANVMQHNNIEFQLSIDAADDSIPVNEPVADEEENEDDYADDPFVRKLLSLRHVPDPLEQWRAASTAGSAALSNYAPIRIEHLDSYVRHRRQQVGGFSQEFQCVETTRQFTWLASTLAENRDKNRYANVVAYDHSRVILSGGGGEQNDDYINANFCDGYRQRNAYIATQGPMSNTICDFWRMVWQQQTTSIVMLTKLDERMRPKCTQYWPQRVGSTETYRCPSEAETDSSLAMTVTLENVDNYAFYVIRKLSVQPASSDGKSTLQYKNSPRTVWQYQFTAWPDHGVPQDATPFLLFVRRVQRAAETMNNASDERLHSESLTFSPLVVHCSAGVGRTGAFIVIDTMLRRLCAREPHLDIFGCVCMLREQRNFMVQTDEQYGFVYDAIMEANSGALSGGGLSDMSPQQLLRRCARSSARKQTVGENRFELEFRKLKMRHNPSTSTSRSQCERALLPANKYKNRDLNTLPYDANSVYLVPKTSNVAAGATPTTLNRTEHSDYINASFIDGYRLKRAYIATQLPLRTTVSDFWRMVCEQNSNIVVMLLNDDELASPSDYCHYWPSETSERFDAYVIYPVAEYNLTCYVLREFKVTDSRDGCSRTVRQFQFSAWNDRNLPVSTENFIEFIGQVHRTKEQFGQDGPITVHCSNGAGRTGLLIAFSAIIERMQYEKRIDVFSTAQLMLMQRMNTIANSAQYEFLYNASCNYLQLYE